MLKSKHHNPLFFNDYVIARTVIARTVLAIDDSTIKSLMFDKNYFNSIFEYRKNATGFSKLYS